MQQRLMRDRVSSAIDRQDYSGGWGYYPSGGLGVVLLIVIVLMLVGRI